jgi:ribulose-5-phosphate 4-epimerase/fuculose-1-phosphate aldolase
MSLSASALATLFAKEDAMATPVHFDSRIGEQFLRYARLVANRGYVHNTLGNMAIRAPHPDHAHGVAYTHHAEISLEEMGMENIVITEIPTSRLLYGSRTTSIGHNLNREILRLRPDIGAVIHVHDDATIAFFSSGAFREVKVLSLDMPFILGKAPYYVPANVDVEADVGPVKEFIADTNTVVLLGHGVTALGRTISEAYHRLNSFTAEIRRNIEAEHLAAIKGTTPLYRSDTEIALMHKHADAIIYPKRAEKVMQEKEAASA